MHNDLTDEWELLSIGLVGEMTGGYQATGPSGRGRFGRLFDLWYGSTRRQTGDTYPNDNTRQFAQFGALVVPWNGTQPRVIF